VPSPSSPAHAPTGDVDAALMIIDSKLKAVYAGTTSPDPDLQQMSDQVHANLGPAAFESLIDGVCTILYVWMRWLDRACQDHGEDLVGYVIPPLVATMRRMTSFPPEAIPTMAGLLVAAATGQSPNLWRAQYGTWTRQEMTPLEGTALLLADLVNRTAGTDQDFATRMIAQALSQTDD
jgi:hypothetical protein